MCVCKIAAMIDLWVVNLTSSMNDELAQNKKHIIRNIDNNKIKVSPCD